MVGSLAAYVRSLFEALSQLENPAVFIAHLLFGFHLAVFSPHPNSGCPDPAFHIGQSQVLPARCQENPHKNPFSFRDVLELGLHLLGPLAWPQVPVDELLGIGFQAFE